MDLRRLALALAILYGAAERAANRRRLVVQSWRARELEALPRRLWCHHTVRGTHGTPEAGTCAAYAPWRTSCPVPRALTLRCAGADAYPVRVQYGGPGTYVSAECAAFA
eukprot:scaffold38088_cov61-Phaeocystis_antarctica.AAC.1